MTDLQFAAYLRILKRALETEIDMLESVVKRIPGGGDVNVLTSGLRELTKEIGEEVDMFRNEREDKES